MRLLLGTSGYSAFMRGHPVAASTLQRATQIIFSPVVLGELKSGFLAGTHRLKNENNLHAFLTSPRVSVASVDEETAVRYAEILHFLRKFGAPIPTNGLWSAASAMQHGLRVLTTDQHFRTIPQLLVELCEIYRDNPRKMASAETVATECSGFHNRSSVPM